jgi:mono/diheme cytochrome c family protein
MAVSFVLVALASVVPSSGTAQDLERGAELYDRWCAECHGFAGAGDGAAASYMLPRPRDFTMGLYQIRTTANGELPTDADMARVIELGMPGTAMPGWESEFSSAEISDLVAYIKGFSQFFERFGAPDPLQFGKPPRLTDEGLANGRRLYEEIECFKCHGDLGRSDGSSAPTLQDDLDFPTRPADLTKNWTFNGGGTVEDIYRRLRTGLDGSPMPSFSDLLDSGFMTEDDLWNLAQYVRSLSQAEPPRVREVIAAGRVEGALPTGPGDPAWDAVDPFYVPMVGQIIVEPRWFGPTVDGLWVRALHDDRDLALLVAWTDPSRSPDPAWAEWQGWIAASLHGGLGPDETGPLPDRLTVQFPVAAPTGRERPYFLLGDTRRPVYLWDWSSDAEGAVEARASGIGTENPLGDVGGLRSAATWDRGEWRVQFDRGLGTADSTAAIQFRQGQAIPIAFFAADGSNGESGARMSISSWYSVYLEQPTSTTVYLSPLLAMLLTAGLGLAVVWRAQRREEETTHT